MATPDSQRADSGIAGTSSSPAAPELHGDGEARARWWLALLLLSLFLLAGCWTAPFLNLDDPLHVRDNPALARDAPWSAVFAWQEGYAYYYPVVQLSWKVDRLLWEPLLGGWLGERAWPAGIRTTNLLLHIAAALILWRLLLQLGASALLAAFVTLAFALHPVACESVCWPVERKNLLAGCLGFAAMLAYVRAAGWGGVALSAALYALAVLSKPAALNCFAILVCWELLGRPRLAATSADGGDSTALSLARRAGSLAPWVVVTVLGIWVGYRAHSDNLMAPPGGSLAGALLTDVVILQRYTWNLLLPVGLSAYYAVRPVVSPFDAVLWGHAAALAPVVIGAVLLAGRQRRRAALFAWLWFLAGLGTNLNLVGINDLLHDRFLYIAAPGFWIAAGLAVAGLARLLPALDGLPRWCLPSAVALLCVSWAAGCSARSALFADVNLLLEDAVRKEPRSATAAIFMAQACRKLAQKAEQAGNPEKAARLRGAAMDLYAAGVSSFDFERFLRQPLARVEFAEMLLEAGRLEEAAGQALGATRGVTRGRRIYHSDRSRAAQVLGLVALRMGRPEEALKQFDEALRYQPDLTAIHINRARALVALQDRHALAGDLPRAQEHYQRAMQALAGVAPSDPAFGEAQDLARKIQAPGGQRPAPRGP